METHTATIGGGSHVKFSLNSRETAAAKSALASLESGYPSVRILTDAGAPASATAFDVYNIAGGINLPTNAEAVVLTGSGSGSIRGHAGNQFLVGNQGDDSINAAGGSGQIIVGDGHNSIQLNDIGQSGGSVDILVGGGSNTVNMWGGSANFTSVGRSDDDRSEDKQEKKTASGGDGGQGSTSHPTKDDDDDDEEDKTSAARPKDMINIFTGANTFSSESAVKLNVAGGTNTLNLGGNDQVTLSGGSSAVNLHGKHMTIANAGGNNSFSISGSGHDTFTGGGANVTQTDSGKYHLHMSGNDTITLGSGNDTIVEAGKATVYAGSGNLNYQGDGASYVVAGSGMSTLRGGGGNDTFVGGSGKGLMSGGGGANLFVAGHGDQTMNGEGATSNIFSFDKTKASGSSDHIKNFTSGRDHIKLVGYDTAAALAGAKVVGGNTILSLNGGATKIELVGFKHLTAADFG